MIKKRILVAGGAGFLGLNLCQRLVENPENHILCVDNFYSSMPASPSLQALTRNVNFEFIRHDITLPLFVEVDQIYNLACPASPVHYQRDPVFTAKTNVIGAINLLGLAKRTKSRILQASTSEVYGTPQVHPQTEEYWGHVNPAGLRSCYDEGKRCAETLCFDYHRQHKTDVRVVRIFNTYGPQMHPQDGRVVSNFIVQALAGKPLTIYGDGKQTRSFCYVSDLIEGFIKMMEQDSFIGPVNLGNPAENTMLELASEILSITKSKSDLVFAPLPSDDPDRRRPNINMAKKVLNWEPTVNLTEGLTNTIDFFRGII